MICSNGEANRLQNLVDDYNGASPLIPATESVCRLCRGNSDGEDIDHDHQRTGSDDSDDDQGSPADGNDGDNAQGPNNGGGNDGGNDGNNGNDQTGEGNGGVEPGATPFFALVF